MSAVSGAVPVAVGCVAPLEVPLRLPRRRYGACHRLEALSASSVRAFEMCPEAFRRRYLLGRREPSTLSMVCGGAVGDALAHYFQGRIDNQPLSRQELDDLVLAGFEAKVAKAKLAAGEDARQALECCRAGALDYLDELAPMIDPISVERRASFRFTAEAEWSFECYFDLECEEEIPDLKFGAKRVERGRAAKDLQATGYAYLRWAEGRPARFVFHSGLLERPEDGPRWEAVPAPRTEAHFRGFEQRIARVARQIVHLDQTEPGAWPLASEWGWWCAPPEGGRGCAHWDSCPVGGGAS